jgi:murein tripeptide amidase MpaA
MKKLVFVIHIIVLSSLIFSLEAQPGKVLTREIALPPVASFHGNSLSLVVPKDDPWITPAERSGLEDSPSYDETMVYLRRMVEASPSLKLVSLGKSAQGRDFWMVIASNRKLFTPDAIVNSHVPVVLAQAGIHSGEIDGKDAGLMLLRDMTVGGRKTKLIDHVVFLFIPVLNVDGHERRSKYNRINQRGPRIMGWRTNARNLNLNRDYAKADTRGIRAVLKCLNLYRPWLYYDIHVTDGIDYQYDITFGAHGKTGFSPAIGAFLHTNLFTDLNQALKSNGHIPGPLVFARDNQDMRKGIVSWFASARFSNGYGDLVHVPTVLVENHSLKPYNQRVLGTYVLLEQSLRTMNLKGVELKKAIEEDCARRDPRIPFKWGEQEQPGEMTFLGIKSEQYTSSVSGTQEVRWLGVPEEIQIPIFYHNKPLEWIQKPKAFYVPVEYQDIIQRLKAHGVEMETITQGLTRTLTMYRFSEPNFAETVYEGHVRVQSDFVGFRNEEYFPAGSVRISLDQPLSDLVMVLLDPRFDDSFFQWGFFNPIFQRTEYTEAYAIEPYAEKMLEDPLVKQAFEKKLEDKSFREDRWARLYWFYEKTPYFDRRWKVYPIGRED